MRGVGLPHVHALAQRVVEVELRREFVAEIRRGIGADLEVHVHGPSGIPPGIDGHELRSPLGVGLLISTQESLAARIELPTHVSERRIHADGVALPDVHHRIRDRLARLAVDPRNVEDEAEGYAVLRRALGGIGADVGAPEHLVDEIRPLRLFRPDDAGRHGRRHAVSSRGRQGIDGFPLVGCAAYEDRRYRSAGKPKHLSSADFPLVKLVFHNMSLGPCGRTLRSKNAAKGK